jgi:hypothetical protein
VIAMKSFSRAIFASVKECFLSLTKVKVDTETKPAMKLLSDEIVNIFLRKIG